MLKGFFIGGVYALGALIGHYYGIKSWQYYVGIVIVVALAYLLRVNN